MSMIIKYFSKLIFSTARNMLGTGISKILPVKKIYIFIIKIFPSLSFINIQGSKMYVNLFDDNIIMRDTYRCLIKDNYETITTNVIKNTIKNGQIVLDIGANYYTLLFSKLVGNSGKVFSFEPEPNNFNILKINVLKNNYTQTRIFNYAVADFDGFAELNISYTGSGEHNLLVNNPSCSNIISSNLNTIKVKTVSLDNFLKSYTNRVDFVKMDIEGSELLALKGMQNIIKNNDKIKVLMEFNPKCLLKMNCKPTQIIEMIFNHFNFKVFVIDEFKISNKGEYFEVFSKEDILSLLKNEYDYLNLLLKK